MKKGFLAGRLQIPGLQRRWERLSPFLLLILSALLGATSAFAQLERGSIEGLVTDSQGSATPGVTVTVTSAERNTPIPSRTDAAGYFRVDNLVPGTYIVHLELTGFTPTDVTGIVVGAGKVARVDTQLKVGATRQSVEVKAQAGLIDTSASNFSATLNEHTIDEMPLQGRDLMQLVYLFPGVNSNVGPPGTNFGFNSQFGTFPDPTNVLGSDVSVNGGEAGANAWYLDGSLNLSTYDENAIISPSPDAVQEFQLVSDGFAAEYGRTGGGVFSTVLKSGTNKIHGSLYEFLRNSATNARNPYTSVSSTGTIIPDRVLHYNDFGGTVGGPVVIPKLYNGKDKTFFFASIDQHILHLWGEQVFTVPTMKMRAGDFSEDPNTATKGLWDPFTTVGPDNNGQFARSAFGTPTAGNPNGCTGSIVGGVAVNPTSSTCNFATSIPSQRIDTISAFFLNGYPAPNYISPLPGCPTASDGVALCNNYQGAVGTAMNPWNSSIKVDHQISQKDHIFGEWLYERGAYDNYAVPWTGPAFSVGSFGFGAKPPVVFRSQIGTLGDTYTFSPTVVNQFRYTFSRQFFGTSPYINGPYASQEDLSAVEKEMSAFYTTTDYPVPWIDVVMPYGGSESLGVQQWNSEDIPGQSHTISDDITKITGKHTIKVGVMYRLDRTSYDLTGFSTPRFYGSMSDNPATGQAGGGGLLQFELGAPQAANGFTVGNIAPWERFRYWGLYVQDDFRLTPSFSLNLGLRWDLYGFFSSQLKPQSRFCPTCMNATTGLPGEVQYDGSPGWAAGGDLYPPNWDNFQPRVNFAWSPMGNKKTVIRGGYDIFVPNSTNASNLGVQVAPPGYQWYGYWQGSYSPSTCAPLHGSCPPWQLDQLTNANAATYPVPFSTTPPALSRDPLLGQSLYYNAKPPHDPFDQSWSLEVQRELPGDMLVTVGYAGNHGTHLQGGVGPMNFLSAATLQQYKSSINASIPITSVYSGTTATELQSVYGSSSLPRSLLLEQYPFYSPFDEAAYGGSDIYHALNVRVEKKLSNGLSFIAAYTWSKKMATTDSTNLQQFLVDPIHGAFDAGGQASEISPGLLQGEGFQDNAKQDVKILSDDDVPQMINIGGGYALPFGKGKAFFNQKGIVNGLIGGWRLTANFNARSGIPLQITGPCDAYQSAAGVSCLPDLIGNPKAVPGGQNANHWINAAAFSPAVGTDQTFWANYNTTDPRAWQEGTASARAPGGLLSPGFWNVDSALFKEFPIRETANVEFRWELFNMLNHQNLGFPNTGYCLSPGSSGATDIVHQAGCSFGQISNVQTDPRSMEFALKITF